MKYFFATVLMLVTMVGSILWVVPVASAASSSSTTTCPDSILGITTWYKGLTNGPPKCEVQIPTNDDKKLQVFITKLVLNIIQAFFGVVAYVTVFFILKGGFNYITSTGTPEGMQRAKKTITNAVIGLVIALLSASIINAVGGAIK